ncbi:hypothetical protein WN48_08924 [Eufriesea mexicana]|uniref:Uncharacterized protein n=1 Tax=Eufriesea mexicana TaxID=516756 RepID=A0A310STF7_9HYME|nr:hypothetical protein WN48_08924 [Eufriesea mexicana]
MAVLHARTTGNRAFTDDRGGSSHSCDRSKCKTSSDDFEGAIERSRMPRDDDNDDTHGSSRNRPVGAE